MKLKKIIKHLLKFFDKKAKKQRKEQSALHQLLQELKHKEKQLCAELEQSVKPEERQAIQDKLDVINAQKSKGKDLLLNLREEKQTQS